MPKQRPTVSPGAISRDSTSRLLPPAALALSLNGFFVYLGLLAVVGRAPRTSTTAAWYALMGLACLAGAALRRRALLERVRSRARLVRVWLTGSALLAVCFLGSVAFVSEGRLSRVLAAQLLLWSLPAALLALSLERPDVSRFAAGAAALGSLFVVIEAGSALHAQLTAGRFTPIAHLDPISAAQYPALGAICLLVLRPESRRGRLVWAVTLAALVAGTILPGSRGPIVELVLGAIVVLAAGASRARLWAVAAIAAGIAIGAAGTSAVGSSCYLTYSTPGTSSDQGCTPTTEATHPKGVVEPAPPPISTSHIRREWWSSALHAIPNDPIVGHGVAMFVDNTPEAHRMGVAGTRTYPHNSPLESAYSLGAIGAALYAVFIVGALVALTRLVRRRDRAAVLAAGVWVYAFASANLSGEIGADAVVWASSALAVGLYASSSR